jgi:hypothetical protein
MWKTCLEDRELLRKRRLSDNWTVCARKSSFSSEFLLLHGKCGREYVDIVRGVSKHEWRISMHSSVINEEHTKVR